MKAFTDVERERPEEEHPETPDIESSSDAYAARFGGAAGAWMLEVQTAIALELLEGFAGGSVLDVGGGHGQIAVPLAERGWDVTVLGSAPECGRRLAGPVNAGKCRFTVGNILNLPFPDLSFDVALSFRLLPHCRRWERLVGELCRVARRAVIVDYPTSESLNRVAPALFGVKKRLEGSTRQWTLFTHADIEREFASRGFTTTRRRPQFFLPMVLHRALGLRAFSAAAEGLFRLAGATSRWGSPVIIRALRGEGRPE